MSVIRNIINRVKPLNKNILLHEYYDPRVLAAVTNIIKDKVANITLLGNKEKILDNINKLDCKNSSLLLSNINIIDPLPYHYELFYTNSNKNPRYNNLDLGHILLKSGLVDGMVSGSSIPSKIVIKSALKYVGLSSETSTLSSFFLMESQNKKPLLFSDCAVVISPNTKQLVDIALSTNRSYYKIFHKKPNIALLSHSTKGSSSGKEVEKVRNAVELVRNYNKDIIIDGELQVDTALIPEISRGKAPKSPIDGNADILIFPNLDSANIGYKLTERLGDYIATGPILQGLSKPSNDLSRGCSIKDIYNTIAFTCL